MQGNDLFVYRRVIKNHMLLDKAGLCDMCRKNAGVEVHEVISRGRTTGNDEARMLSYDKHICSLLCRDCHEDAHNLAAADVLLQRNIDVYGYEPVKVAFDAVQAVMRTKLNIPFPEPAADPGVYVIGDEKDELRALWEFFTTMRFCDVPDDLINDLNIDGDFEMAAQLEVIYTALKNLERKRYEQKSAEIPA